jgi:hypothetical protein
MHPTEILPPQGIVRDVPLGWLQMSRDRMLSVGGSRVSNDTLQALTQDRGELLRIAQRIVFRGGHSQRGGDVARLESFRGGPNGRIDHRQSRVHDV